MQVQIRRDARLQNEVGAAETLFVYLLFSCPFLVVFYMHQQRVFTLALLLLWIYAAHIALPPDALPPADSCFEIYDPDVSIRHDCRRHATSTPRAIEWHLIQK